MKFSSKLIQLIFVFKWTIATAIGITVGKFLGTFVAGLGLGFPLRLSGALAIGGVVVAAFVGLMQRWVLRQYLINQLEKWTVFTALGGFFGGALAGIVIFIIPVNVGEYTNSTVVGFIAGTTVGVMQWRILKKSANKARWWILANSIAWAVGECLLWAVIFLIMKAERVIVNGVVIGFLTLKGEVVIFISGAVTGLITGIVLLWLLETNKNSVI